MSSTASRTGAQREVALVLIIAAGIVSLPLVAALLDGPSTEDLIVPVQLAVMALVGAVVGYLLPGLAGAGSRSARGAGFGALVGVATALLSVAVFYLLLNGSSGG